MSSDMTRCRSSCTFTATSSTWRNDLIDFQAASSNVLRRLVETFFGSAGGLATSGNTATMSAGIGSTISEAAVGLDSCVFMQ